MFQAVKDFLSPQALVNTEAEAWHRQYRRTPDLWYLNQHGRQLVFIADEFKTGKEKHELISQAPIHPSCYTVEEFTVYNKDLGVRSFPLPFEKGVDFQLHGWYKPELARIQGELYALPSPLMWKVLDIHKENGVQFFRKRVSITVPWRDVTFNEDPKAEVWVSKIPNISNDRIRTVRAWMYIALPDYWDDFLGVHLGTRPVPIFTHNTPKDWIKEYYKF